MDRFYSEGHLWIGQEGQLVCLGMSDYAQEKLRNILFVNLPDVGDELIEGQVFGDVESVKTVSDLVAPVNGTVVEINDALDDDPSAINEAPYDAWLVKNSGCGSYDHLMNEDEYKDYINKL